MIGWSEARAGVGVITLSRPPVNALDRQAKREMDARLEALSRRSDIRCVVFRSALPSVFCAGSDLHELALEHQRPGVAIERTRFELDLWQRLSGLPQVSIAAIEGHALGSGLELAIACDFRVAGEAASLGLPEVRIGGAPGVQATARLPLLVGLGMARRMLLTGRPLGAREAKAAGLVDELVPSGEAEAAAMRWAAELAERPAGAIGFLKAALAAASETMTGQVEARVLGGVEALFQGPEMREGIAAFLEKREPDFGSARPIGEEARA